MDREIFTYWNGKKQVKADPMRIEIAWNKACMKVDINEIMSKFIGPDFFYDEDGEQADISKLNLPEDVLKLAYDRRMESIEELIPVICSTFKLEHIDDNQEDGLLDAEIIEVYTNWQNFISELKKNTVSNVNSPPSTVAPSQPTITSDSTDGDSIPKELWEYSQSPSRRV